MKELVLINENRFYVYQHRLVKCGSLILVGHGTKHRARSQHGRNKKWHEITKDNAWYFSILKDGMTKEAAEELEVAIISIYNPIGNTHKGTLEAKKLNLESLSKRYYYDATSPTGLRYKVDNGQEGKKKRVANDPAGCKHPRGHFTVHDAKRNVLVHRVVWLMCTGEDPGAGFCIDHIDGNPSNNALSNLRKVTVLENNRNVCLRKDNSSGYKGVNYSKEGFFVASWYENMKDYQKAFSCLKHGSDVALALAIEYRHLMVTKQNTLGNRLTERHTGTYARHSALSCYSDSEITEMINCELTSNNTSGFNGISHLSVRGHSFWEFNYARTKPKRFSVSKYGDVVAKCLAIEYGNRFNGNSPNNIEGYSLNETNSMLTDTTRNNNQSGINGLNFVKAKKGTIVVAQKMINYKNFRKTFDICKLGLLEAIAESLRWRKNFTG